MSQGRCKVECTMASHALSGVKFWGSSYCAIGVLGMEAGILHSLLLWLCLSRLAEMESQNCSFFNDSLSPDDSM